MAEWNRGDAEMAIAIKRAELNSALTYKLKYDAEEHNVCLALLKFKDGSSGVLAAYSKRQRDSRVDPAWAECDTGPVRFNVSGAKIRM